MSSLLLFMGCGEECILGELTLFKMSVVLMLVALMSCFRGFSTNIQGDTSAQGGSNSDTTPRCRRYIAYRLCLLPREDRPKAITCMENTMSTLPTYKIGQAIQWCVNYHIDHSGREESSRSKGPFDIPVVDAMEKLCSVTRVQIGYPVNYMKAIGREAALVMDCVVTKAAISDDRFVVLKFEPKCFQGEA
ncbi:uncharacterized protein LOC111088887 [Limulus polyphemus]|uniref:Uncharacterized protein LOC111088887 n=1 Tax=Limulus polyphemus TaxID=6850 RepID=A0ABM1TIU9_LIMPO|nr:uncharacterized protein LOC111088887 [Limulus polyphemus]